MLPCALVDKSVRSFQAINPNLIYVLSQDGSLWRISGDYQTKELVDTNVKAFQALDQTTVYVLDDGETKTLWREIGDHQTKTLVDSDVLAFQALNESVVFVLGKDLNLWREIGSKISRSPVDGTVRSFQAIDQDNVLVLGDKDSVLWLWGAIPPRWKVDEQVMAFQYVGQKFYVLGSDGTLWREKRNWHDRELVDASVHSFQALDEVLVYVLGSDGKLWRETVNNQTRFMVDWDVQAFQALSYDQVFVLRNNGELWRGKKQELYIGVDDDDINGPFSGFLNAPADWMYVAANANGFYVSDIAMANTLLKFGETEIRARLTRLARLFTNSNVFYESDVLTAPQDDIRHLDILLDSFATVPFSALNDGNSFTRVPVSSLTAKIAALRHRDPSRPVLAMQAPWQIHGDLDDNNPGANSERDWIEGMSGSATDGPLGSWHIDDHEMKHGSYSMVWYSQARGKFAMVILAPASTKTPSEFLSYGKDCVADHETNNAIPNIWVVSYYDAKDQVYPVTPESSGGQASATITGLAYWLLHRFRQS